MIIVTEGAHIKNYVIKILCWKDIGTQHILQNFLIKVPFLRSYLQPISMIIFTTNSKACYKSNSHRYFWILLMLPLALSYKLLNVQFMNTPAWIINMLHMWTSHLVSWFFVDWKINIRKTLQILPIKLDVQIHEQCPK